jgi:hypothetical protein
MSLKELPGEIRNAIYSELLDQIEDHTLIFANWIGGPVPVWLASKTPRAPIGLLTTDKQTREECLSLALSKANIHVRILSSHLKSSDELYAWVSDTDCIPFSSLNTSLLTKLSLTIFLPYRFKTTINKNQGINFTFLSLMTRLKLLRLRIQVNVQLPLRGPWLIYHHPVPNSTFTPFVNRTIESIFRHLRRETIVEFGDGVGEKNGGLGSWVDVRANGRRNSGWMFNPDLAEFWSFKPSSRYRGQCDTVAMPIWQAEKMFGELRWEQGMVRTLATMATAPSVDDEGEAENGNSDGILEDDDIMVGDDIDADT